MNDCIRRKTGNNKYGSFKQRGKVSGVLKIRKKETTKGEEERD